MLQNRLHRKGEHKMKGISFCAVLYVSLFCTLEASLKSYFVDELCYETSRVVFGSTSATSGVVQFLASSKEPVDCEIVWRPGYKISPVLSIVSYNLHSEDELIITDSDRFSVKLVGTGYFPDERKAFVSDGDLTIRFKTNHTRVHPFDKVKFHFVYTMTRRGPCSFNEYECNNGKCIDESLVCDSHNHCGDRSDQKKCVPLIEKIPDRSRVTHAGSRTNPWIVTIIVVSVIFGVVVLALISAFIHQLVKNKKDPGNQTGSTPSTHDEQPATSFYTRIRRSFRTTRKLNAEEAGDQSQIPENNPTSSVYPQVYPSSSTSHESQHPRPSFLSQVKRSFRSANNPKATEVSNELQRSENYQTPSMYPEIPSAPELSGVDNPDFRLEE